MTQTDTLRLLTGALYEAALDPDRLSVFLRELTSLAGADASVLAVADASGAPPMSVAHGIEAETARAAADVLLRPDSRAAAADPAAWRRALKDPTVAGTQGVTVDAAPGQTGLLAVISRERPLDTGQATLLEAFRPHLPHVLRLLRAMDAVGHERDLLQALGNAVGHAVGIVEDSRRVLATNRTLDRLLARAEGLALRNGHLCAEDAAAEASLQRLFRQARDGGKAVAGAMPRGEGRRPLGLVLTPLPSVGNGAVRFALHVSALETTPVPPADVLSGLFDLTPAEARLLQALAADQRIEDYAEARGVSVTTVRTQLAHLFRKTGTNRQPDLVRLATVAGCCLAYDDGRDTD